MYGCQSCLKRNQCKFNIVKKIALKGVSKTWNCSNSGTHPWSPEQSRFSTSLQQKVMGSAGPKHALHRDWHRRSVKALPCGLTAQPNIILFECGMFNPKVRRLTNKNQQKGNQKIRASNLSFDQQELQSVLFQTVLLGLEMLGCTYQHRKASPKLSTGESTGLTARIFDQYLRGCALLVNTRGHSSLQCGRKSMRQGSVPSMSFCTLYKCYLTVLSLEATLDGLLCL